MSNDNLTIVPVTVTINDEDGVYSATFDPSPAVVPGAGILEYTLDTSGWAFGDVTFAAPFSDLETISPTQFKLTDNGGPRDTTNSFNVVIVQTDAHRGAAVQLETDPEVLNGPHP